MIQAGRSFWKSVYWFQACKTESVHGTNYKYLRNRNSISFAWKLSWASGSKFPPPFAMSGREEEVIEREENCWPFGRNSSRDIWSWYSVWEDVSTSRQVQRFKLLMWQMQEKIKLAPFELEIFDAYLKHEVSQVVKRPAGEWFHGIQSCFRCANWNPPKVTRNKHGWAVSVFSENRKSFLSQNFLPSDWLLNCANMASGRWQLLTLLWGKIMLMNVLASGFLFLFIGPFKHVSSGKTKAAGKKTLLFRSSVVLANFRVRRNFHFVRAFIACIAPLKAEVKWTAHMYFYWTGWLFRSQMWWKGFFSLLYRRLQSHLRAWIWTISVTNSFV